MSFPQYPSFHKLQDLSKNPIDLTKPGVLSEKRIQSLQVQALDFHLLYATERVDKKILQALVNLAKESKAVHKMKEMQEGKIMNQIIGFESEKRAVLHTAVRALFSKKPLSLKAKKAAKASLEEIEKLKFFLKKIDKQKKFTDIVQVGIGGSDLGPRALYIALEAYRKKGRKAHFISNVDPDDVAHVLQNVNLSKTLFVVVSKSGNTLETCTNEELIRSMLRKKKLNPKNHIIAVTGEKSPMDDPSRYLASFYMWDYIGGRYSATSMVGAVTLGFSLGLEKFLEILQGASLMDEHALTKDPLKNLPLLSALLGIWNHNFLQLPTVAVIPYSQALLRFPAHLQQLDMESNGKSIDIRGKPLTFWSGPIVWGEPGTNGQHSFYQLIHQGTIPVPLELIGFKHSQYEQDLKLEGTSSQEKLLANLFAQAIALATGKKVKNPNKCFSGNRPSRILLAPRLTPKILGALLAYYEHKVAFQGFIWGINSFDQEGVQLGKVLASEILKIFKGEKSLLSTAKAYLKVLQKM